MRPRRYRLACWAVAAAVVVFSGWLALQLGGQWVTFTLVDNIGEILAPVVAAVVCGLRARRETGRLRTSWLLLGASCLAWGAGQVVWTYYELIAHREVPFPSLADIGYLAAVPLAAAGLLAQGASARRRVAQFRTVLDGTIIAAAVLFISWATVLGPTFHAGGNSVLEQILALAYPVGDVVTIALVIFMLAGGRAANRLPVTIVGAGLAAIALADSGFAYATQAGIYATARYIDIGWFVGYLVVALGALHPDRRRTAEVESRATNTLGVVLPYVPVFVAFSVAAAKMTLGHGLDAFSEATGFVLVAVVVLRQVLAVLEHAALARALESRVAERTVELSERERHFRSLVQNGSDLILLTDPQGTVRYASPSTERLLGCAPTAFVGTTLTSFVHPDDREQVQPILTAAEARPGAVLTTEWRMRHADGGWRWMETMTTSRLADTAVAAVVLNSRDVSERKAAEEQLHHQAFHDTLTGLANRALFRDRLEHAITAIARRGGTVGVLFLDLDDFKTVNDTAGHVTGDALLEAVALRLSTLVRPGDTVARLGGDEFAILVEELADIQAVSDLAERIQESMRQPFLVEGNELFIRASAGIRVVSEPHVAADEVLRAADVAMYVAKSDGKGCYRIFDPAMHEALVERLALQADLKHAVERAELVVYYQPLVSLTDERIVGVEALVRWQHPNRGLVPPVEFIPIAEQTGVIVPMGAWILETACTQMRELDATGTGGLDLSVNVSVRQLVEPGFVTEVADILDRTGFPAHRLVLELTESMLIENTDTVLDVLHQLRDLGLRLAIDDFGTGFSSLAYLAKLPVAELKIDRSFVAAMAEDSANDRMVRSIVKLAHDFHLHIVAEGIEDAEAMAHLRTLGCEQGQGYYFAKPMPAAALAAYLRQGRPAVPTQRATRQQADPRHVQDERKPAWSQVGTNDPVAGGHPSLSFGVGRHRRSS